MPEAMLLEDDLLKGLIAAGIRAPSGDNCQPWQFRLQDERHTLAIDLLPERAKSFFDFEHHASFLSIGAVIENIRTEAAWRGYDIQVAYPAATEPGRAAALIRLYPSQTWNVDEYHRQAMLQRTVNRRPFFRKRPHSWQLDALQSAQLEGVSVDFYTNRRQIGMWARLIYLADRIRYSHPVIHEELFSKILLSKEAIESRRVGLEYDRLGIGPGARGILKVLRPWSRMQKLAKWKIDQALANQSRMLALSSGAIGLVSVPCSTPVAWMNSGEQVERLWIEASVLGLCTHPMTVVLYLVERYRQEGMNAFLPIHRPWLEEMDEGLERFLNGRTGTMVFRLGIAMKMKGTAVRLPLEAFLPH